MTDDVWPPRYVNVPVEIIRDSEITLAAFRFYCKLRALAWQKRTVRMAITELMEETGLSRTRLYEYARALRDRSALLWQCADDVFEYSFNPLTYDDQQLAADNPEKRDAIPQNGISVNSSFKNSSSLKEEEIDTKELTTANEKSRKPGLPAKPSGWHYSIAHALAEVCHMDFEGNRGRLFSEAKQMEKSSPEPTPELLRQHYNSRADCYWRKHDWRGQKGQDPTPWAIRQTWGKWVYVATAPDNEPAGWAALDEVKRMRKESANGH
jgi:hypothetical protein